MMNKRSALTAGVKDKRRIIVVVLAILAAVVLFATYGTVLPATPFSPIQIDRPTTVDSNGNMTAVVDSESRRALILNADGDLTGVVECTTLDAPFDAITDVCVCNNLVYLSGITYAPDSDVIAKERVATCDKGGNLQEVKYEEAGTNNVTPSIKSLSNVPGGIAIAHMSQPNPKASQGAAGSTDSRDGCITFTMIDDNGPHQLAKTEQMETFIHDAAFSMGNKNTYVTLSFRGVLNDDVTNYSSQAYDGHVFTAIDLDDHGNLYACDDETGALCVSPSGSADIKTLVAGKGYNDVHENDGVISLCDSATNEIKLCTTSGEVTRSFSEVKPSFGFSARMLVVWASGIYLAVVALVLVVRRIRRQVASGNLSGVGPLLLSVSVVVTITIAIGNLSLSSYQSSLQQRANQINAYADYLQTLAPELSEAMTQADNRNALRSSGEQLGDSMLNLINAIEPAISLVATANNNDIGMYCAVYGCDEKGAFYLYGSSLEHVMGTSARASGSDGLEDAFSRNYALAGKLLEGRTLRDTAQYRFVQIPTEDEGGIAGIIEIGSKMRSFESSIANTLVQRILGLLAMVLVVYLAYCELRACGRCLFLYRERKAQDPEHSVAVLTRPFTLAITMLTSIDSVMTVLIARDLLSHAGMGESSSLVVLPAITLGVGTIVGQGLYGTAGSRIGLRKLMTGGALVMMLCACLAGAAVVSNNFWLYCAAKLVIGIPFGLLYALGFSLPRLATDDKTRAMAADGVNRTNTSAAALGTILGGYAAQGLGNAWVYVLVAVACVPVIIMALNLLPRGMRPPEQLTPPDNGTGRMRDLYKSRTILAITCFVVLPAAIATGYSSLIFPLFSTDLGLAKADINNIVVLGQLVVYVCIGGINRINDRFGKWHVTTASMLLLGVVFLLFAVNTTLVWSLAVIALVALLYKSSEDWKGLWPVAAHTVGVPAGPATAALLAVRSFALATYPFVLGALVGAADYVAVIVIGAICVVSAGLFFLTTRHSELV